MRWRFNAPPVHVVLAHTNVRCRRRIKRQTTAQATLFVHMQCCATGVILGSTIVASRAAMNDLASKSLLHRAATPCGDEARRPLPAALVALVDQPRHRRPPPPAAIKLAAVRRDGWQLDHRARDAFARRRQARNCPGRKPPFFAVKRAAGPYKNAIESRFTAGNTQAA